LEFKVHPEVKIGHIHLTVSDLQKSLSFYRDLLGFEITTYYGDSAVFLSAGGYHHHIGLNTWSGKGAPPPPAGTTGLYHFAILYPGRKELARV
jgi:catechol 2,3-dioxygenase